MSFGYLRDEPRHRTQKDVRALLASMRAQALPEATSLRKFAAPVLDQGPTSACIGHGSAQGICIGINSIAAQSGNGLGLPWTPSPRHIYYGARCASDVRPDASMTLQDGGAYPANGMWAVQRYGIRPIEAPSPDGRYSDVDPSNVNEDLDFGDLEQGDLTIVVGEYRINEAAFDVVEQVKQTLAVAQVPVGVGFQVDRAFMAGSSSAIDEPGPDILGGHWTTVIGYRPSATRPGEIELEIVNSWGAVWSVGGYGWATEAWLRRALDIYAYTVRPA